MGELWIIGGGKFGERAVKHLKNRFPGSGITIIEKEPEKCQRLKSFMSKVICEDGILFLAENLTPENAPDWVVPAVPIHLAYEWICRRLPDGTRADRVPVPGSMRFALPNPIAAKNGDLFVSIADFICPDNCPEPDDFCTHTRKKREYRLYEKIRREIPGGFTGVVIRSVQLAPGVGGLRPDDLFNGLASAVAARNPVIQATACKCHGVITAFNTEQGKG